MFLLQQVATIAHAYREAPRHEDWMQGLGVHYSFFGNRLQLQKNKRSLSSRLISILSKVTEKEETTRLVQAVTCQLFAVFEKPYQSKISPLDNGWPYIGRWLASMPDAGMEVLTILSNVASHSNHTFEVLTKDDLVEHWSRLARSYLDRLAQEEKQLRQLEVWSRLKAICSQGEKLNAFDSFAVNHFFRQLNQSVSDLHPSDFVVAIWPEISHSASQDMIEAYYRFATYVQSLKLENCSLGPQRADELVQQARDREDLKKTKPNLFYHPQGFLPLLDALHNSGENQRVMPPPTLEHAAPFLSFVELEKPEIEGEAWRLKWLATDAKATKKLKALAKVITLQLDKERMPDFTQWHLEAIAFSGDRWVSVHAIPWTAFNLFDLENFVWNFCENSIKHYEVFLDVLSLFSNSVYREQVNRLKRMMGNRGLIENEWVIDDIPCDLFWYDRARTQVQTYLEQATRELQVTEDVAASLGENAISQLFSHALRSSVEEWMILARRELEHRQTTAAAASKSSLTIDSAIPGVDD